MEGPYQPSYNQQQYSQAPPREPLWARILVFIPIIGWIFKAGYNVVRYGHPMPHGFGGGTRLILVSLVFLAIALLVIPIFVSVGGTQGVMAGLQRIFTGAGEAVDTGLGEYTRTVQQSMGLSYASEIDQHARTDIGLRLEEIGATQRYYRHSDSITIWGLLSGNAPGRERRMNVELGCSYRAPGLDSTVERGFISPTDSFMIDRDMTRDFRCEFPSGTIRDDMGAHRVEISADFDFETMAYFTIPFMDEEAYLSLRRSEPSRVAGIPEKFTSQNTYSPVQIGMGARDFPVLIREDGDSSSFIGFSLNDRWGGMLTDISSFTVMMPDGIFLEDCDGPIDFVPDDVQEDDFFTNYTMVDDGIAHLESRLQTGDRYDRFEPQSFQCFLSFDSGVIFDERSRLDPVELNIFSHIEFDYSLLERVHINLRDDPEDLRARVEPSLLTLNTQPLVEVSARRGELDSATVTMRHRPASELSSDVIDGYESRGMQRTADGDLRFSFSESLASVIDDLERGDTVLFDIEAMTRDGERLTTLRTYRIQNKPPELIEDGLSISMRDDEVSCTARAIDGDGDGLDSGIFVFRSREQNQEYEIDGACEEKDEYWLCMANARLEKFDDDDIVECSVTLYDGIDYNRLENRVELTLTSVADAPEDDEEACESDGFSTHIRGFTSGLKERDGGLEYIESWPDTCLDENTMRDYHCDENTNRVVYRDIDCECFDGVCV